MLSFNQNPAINETIVFVEKIFKYLNTGWQLVRTEAPDSGNIDCNFSSETDILFQGGAAFSNFTGLKGIDCGEG